MRRRQIFWYLLLLASGIAAFVSLLTTSLGLGRYIPTFLAWLLALAVQLGLFGLAWLITSSQSKLRGLVIVLYLLTMPFSVVFSYVTLQSAFTARVRPQEQQRRLLDNLRPKTFAIDASIHDAVRQAQDLELRLNAWLRLEEDVGWTTMSCEGQETDSCYLQGVCSRIRNRLGQWEQSFGRVYREGPGQELIYGLLKTETEAITRTRTNLESRRDKWSIDRARILAPTISNRERLIRYDAAVSSLPIVDLSALLCKQVVLPVAPMYEEFARDENLEEEQPIYAFDDLIDIFQPGRSITRNDYPTVFALGLALFVDLFVLFVAIGAAFVEEESIDDDAAGEAQSLGRVAQWVDEALLRLEISPAVRREFVRQVLAQVSFDSDGQAYLMPRDATQVRFAFVLVRAQGAELREADQAGRPIFALEDWAYAALARFVASVGGV